MVKVTNEIWSDLDIDLTPHPVSNDLVRLTNEDAVKRSVKNLVLTSFYERKFNARLGSNIQRYLFEPLDNITKKLISDDIRLVIENYEPRAEVVEIKVGDETDLNELRVTIIFAIINTNLPISLDVVIDRVR